MSNVQGVEVAILYSIYHIFGLASRKIETDFRFFPQGRFLLPLGQLFDSQSGIYAGKVNFIERSGRVAWGINQIWVEHELSTRSLRIPWQTN